MVFKEMVAIDPKRNPVFTAIDTLEELEDIQKFVHEYEEYMVKNSNDETKGEEREIARRNVRYILGYFDKHVSEKWYKLLPAPGQKTKTPKENEDEYTRRFLMENPEFLEIDVSREWSD